MDAKSKMLIDATHPEETRVVVLKNGRVEEFDYESAARKPLRGNIYLAKVTRVEPSLQAAFVDYGGNRHGFLAFSEIHPDYYQIPFADRQALLQEEAEAEAAAEAEADARAEARAQRHEKRRRPRRDEADEASASEHAENGDTHEHNGAHDDAGHDHYANGVDSHHDHYHEGDENSRDRGDDAHSHDNENDGQGEQPGAIAASAYSNDDVRRETPHEHDHDHHHDRDHEAESTETSTVEHGHDEREARSEAGSEGSSEDGESHVEDVGSDTTEAPEDIGASPEQVGSEDVLEEVPERPRRRMRSYKIQEVIKRRQIILVQVVKEERGSKGAALTTYLSLAGRYTVLMPNTGRGGGISRKITNPQDRKRLKAIAHELEVPEGMGLIVRTAGAARTKQELKRDFEYLLRLWENVRDMTLQSTAPCLVYEEGNLIKRSIRDLYTKDTDEILVAGEQAHREAQDFMRMLSPSQAKNVIKFEDKEPLFARFNIERQLNAMFSPYVTLRSGGYLVINQTEALVSIDVNSGKATREFSIEETALQTNLEAAEELARQLKLRDLAGLIVIDFIDMEERRNNRKVEQRLKDALRHDRARIQVGRISHFGLLEMSRQRLRTGVVEGSTSQCPHCQGTGIVRSTESVALAVLRAIEDQLVRDARSSVTALTTADVALYILNNKRSYITDMERRHGVTITVEASPRMQGANFAIEKSAAPVQKAPERSAAVNMAWGFEGADEDVEPAGDEGEEHAPQASESEGGRRRRRRRRGRRDDRGEQRATGDDAPFANGEGGDGQPAYLHEEHGPEDGFAEGPEELPGVGDQPSISYGEGEQPATEEEREERRGRRRRRGRRGGRRGRDREGLRAGEEQGAGSEDGDHYAHGADLREVTAEAADDEHTHRAVHDTLDPEQDRGHDPHVAEDRPLSGSDEQPVEQAPPPARAERRERKEPERREPPAEVSDHEPAAEPAQARSTDDRWSSAPDEQSPAAGSSETSGEAHDGDRGPQQAHSEPQGDTATVEEDDPSRPPRRGWWQRRFSGA